MRHHTAPPRGFTLTELMIASGITAFTIGVVAATFTSQQRGMEAVEVARSAQRSAQRSLLPLERDLRVAGYGVAPWLVFDFNSYRCGSADQVNGLCRDFIDRPDRFTFHTRDAQYRIEIPDGHDTTITCTDPTGCEYGNAWRLVGVDTTGSEPEVRINFRQKVRLERGRILQFVCNGARTDQTTYGTVAATSSYDAGVANVKLMATPTAPPDPFRANAFGQSCFTAGLARVFLIDRAHYFVAGYDLDETVTGDAPVPFLMLDTGRDLDGDGTGPWEGDGDDLVPIAEGIEDMQVAYVWNRPAAGTVDTAGNTIGAPDADGTWVLGDRPGVQEQPDPTLAFPVYTSRDRDPLRFNRHPANIRAIRLSLAVRTARRDPGQGESFRGDPYFQLLNRNQLPPLPDAFTPDAGFRRVTFDTLVNVRNLATVGGFDI